MKQLVETRITRVKEADAIKALYTALQSANGENPTVETVALMFAQISFETGRFSMCRNWNVGNLKAANYDGMYCMYNAGERVNGINVTFFPPHWQTHFRAYECLYDGMLDYVRLIFRKPSFAAAVEALKRADVKDYAKALRDGGYYTDTLKHYSGVLEKLYAEFLPKCKKVLCDEADPYCDTSLYDGVSK